MPGIATRLAAVVLCWSANVAVGADDFDVSVLDGPSFGFTPVVVEKAGDHLGETGIVVKDRAGIVLVRSTEGSLMHAAGVPSLAMLVAINGWKISNMDELLAALAPIKVGDKCNVTFFPATVGDMVLNYPTKQPITNAVVVPDRKTALLSRLWKDIDKVSGLAWMKNAGKNESSGETCVRLYFQVENNKPLNLRVNFRLVQPTLHIPQEIGVRAGDQYDEIKLKPFEAKWDIAIRKSESWVDRSVDDELLSVMARVAKQGHAIVRYRNANSQVVDVDLTPREAQDIGDMLLGFKVMGGAINNKHLSWDTEQSRASAARMKEAAAKVTLMKRGDTSVKPKPAPKEPVKGKEETAASKLKLAKSVLEKNETAGRKRLEEIVAQYPDTSAAEEAKRLLEKKP